LLRRDAEIVVTASLAEMATVNVVMVGLLGSASLEPKARVHRMLDAKVEIGHITRTARQSPPRNQSRRRSDFVPDVRIEMRHSLLCPRNRNRLQNKFCAVGFRLFDKQSRSRMKQTRPRANPRSVRRHCFNSLNN
jgi:hypothetical protein